MVLFRPLPAWLHHLQLPAKLGRVCDCRQARSQHLYQREPKAFV